MEEHDLLHRLEKMENFPASPSLIPAVLARLGLENAGVSPSTSIEALAQALRAEEWQVRLSAVRRLRLLENQKADELLMIALQDTDEFVRMTAQHALEGRGKAAHTPPAAKQVPRTPEVYREADELSAREAADGPVEELGGSEHVISQEIRAVHSEADREFAAVNGVSANLVSLLAEAAELTSDFHQVPPRQSGSWEQYDFDDDLYEVFMSRLKRDLGASALVSSSGGLAGARTSSIRLEGKSNTNVQRGQYILKVCLSERAEREIQMHQAAKASLTLQRYVPEFITATSYPDLPLTGILYKVTEGRHLVRTTLQKSLELQHFLWGPIEALARVMLRWNFAGSSLSRSTDLPRTMFKGVEKEELPALIKRLRGIVDHPEHSHLVLSKLGVVRYNPVHFLLGQETLTPLRQMPFVIPKGIVHGDLHPGNVIIPINGGASSSFHVIDFAASRPGNAFFDLAYLEITMLLNSFDGLRSIAELRSWWKLEQALVSAPLPRLGDLAAVPQALRVLPIRRTLARRMHQDYLPDDYWTAFLAASVEAGLDLARKLKRRSEQRAAFLTAVSRFHSLMERLGATKTPPKGEESYATLYWPGEEPPESEEEKALASRLSGVSPSEEGRTKLGLVWPSEITRHSALYDPWKIVETIGDTLTGEHNQGVLLVGERKFGKTSFFNCVNELFSKEQGNLRAIRLNALNSPVHSAQSFAAELLSKLCESAGLPYDNIRQQFDREGFFSARQSLVNEKKGLRFVICIDEIDATLNKAPSEEVGHAILHLLAQLLTDPGFPVRLLITATDREVLERYQEGAAFLENLQTWKIPLIAGDEVRGLIERFEIPVTFKEDALSRIFYYSGGQIYLIKLVLYACQVLASKNKQRIISASLVDELMHTVIEPPSNALQEIRKLHEALFTTMSDIYEKHFSDDEQRFLRLLAEAGGVLLASSFEVGEANLASVANVLYRRGYVSKTELGEMVVYSWRIGIWQLFLENRHRFSRHLLPEVPP